MGRRVFVKKPVPHRRYRQYYKAAVAAVNWFFGSIYEEMFLNLFNCVKVYSLYRYMAKG